MGQRTPSASLPPPVVEEAPPETEWKLNRFQIRRKLGEGGMGVVYEAYDRELQTAVALKTFHRFDPGHLYRLKQEFRALAELSHRNLVTLYELILADDTCYIAMELIEGGRSLLEYVRPFNPDKLAKLADSTKRGSSGSLEALDEGEANTDSVDPDIAAKAASEAAERSRTMHTAAMQSEAPMTMHTAALVSKPAVTSSPATGSLSTGAGEAAAPSSYAAYRTRLLATTIDYDRLRSSLRQLCQGVHALHGMGKLHRDLKPSNVLVTRDGRVVICDFGLVKELKDDKEPKAKESVVGTVAYMSPEQSQSDRLTFASDWYAVGVILYEALTARLPFGYQYEQILLAHRMGKLMAPRDVAQDIPDDLNKLCCDLLRIDPAQRPSGAEVLSRLGEAAAGVRASTSAAPSDRPFVGRTTQLKALWEAYDATRKGDTVVQFVRGAPGMGKSALAARFLDALPAEVPEEVVILASKCYASESVPYNAIDSLIDALSGYLKGLSDETVETLLPPGVVELARLFPVLQRVDAVARLAGKGPRRANEQEQRRRAFSALTEILRRLAADRSLVLCIDNFQHCDKDSATLLVHLLGHSRSPPLLFLACENHQERGTSWLVRQLSRRNQQGSAGSGGSAGGIVVRELTLAPLSVPQGRALARLLLEGDESFHIAERIVNGAAGNPLLLEELAAAWARRKAQAAALPVAERDADLKQYADNMKIEGVLLERTRSLSEEARTLLRTCAVAGRPMPQDIVYRAAELGEKKRHAATMLRTERLARVDGLRETDRIEISHDGLKQAVLATLPPPMLKQFHRRLAEALVEAQSPDHEAVAEHWIGADEPERGRAAAITAADTAAQALAFDRAARLYRMALDLRGTATPEEDRHLRARLGQALANAGRGPEAAAAFLSAARGGSAADAIEYRRLAAEQYFQSGHVDEGLTVLYEALEYYGMRLPRTPRGVIASLVWQRMRLKLRNLRYRERDESEVSELERKRSDVCASALLVLAMVNGVLAANLQARDILRSLEVGEPKRLARALALEAVYMGASGQGGPHEIRAVKLANELADRSGDPSTQAFVKNATALGHYHSVQFPAALAVSEEALALFEGGSTAGNLERNMAKLVNVWTLFYLGRVEEIMQRVPDLMRDAETQGDWFMFANLCAGIPNVRWLFANDPDTARRLTQEGIKAWPTGSGRHIQGYWEAYSLAQADLYRGEKGTAWKGLDKEWPRIVKGTFMRIRLLRAEAWHLRGRCAIDAAAAGTREQGPMMKEARTAVAALMRQRTPCSEAWAKMLRAGLSLIEDRRWDAIRLLGEAEGAFTALDMKLYAMAARHRRGELLRNEEGRALIVESERWMLELRIPNPQAVVACLAPGFRGLG